MELSDRVRRWIWAAVGLTPAVVVGQAVEPAGQAPAADPPVAAQADAGVAPTTRPASPEVVKFFGEVRAAYNKIDSVEMKGNVARDIDVAGQKEQNTTAFTSAFKAPNLFRHQMGEEVVIGSTGSKSYAFSPQENVFLQFDLPAGQPLTQSLPMPVAGALQQQNPALWQVVEEDAMAKVEEFASLLSRVEDVKIGERSFPAYRMNQGDGSPDQTIVVDPQTHLIRRIVTDLKPVLLAQGAPQVNSATITIDYEQVDTQAQLAADRFAWSAPAGARDVVAEAEAQQAARPSMQLKGQEAPKFEAPTLTGEKFTLAEHKGKVVVLDFWATWCAPCVQSLPGLQEVAKAAGEDVRVVTVNMAEDPAAVKQFLNDHPLALPIVMDADGKIAEQYKVEAIPHQVVIDPAGNVQEVFIGAGPDAKDKLKAAIDKAKAVKADAPKANAEADPAAKG